MGMSLGDAIEVTLFGESHGECVGALLEGMPIGVEVNVDTLIEAMEKRRPGGPLSSRRKESDECKIMSGVYQGKTTGDPILLLIENKDVRSSDYSFLPDHPRPGHADLPAAVRSDGHADPRGGGSNSARLTAGLVAAGAITSALLENILIEAGVVRIGDVCSSEWGNSDPKTRCRDANVSELMVTAIEQARKELDSLGSQVEVRITGLPIGIGEPWFDGIEPALARGLMAIPAARAVEFGRGVQCAGMKGSQHNDDWMPDMQLSKNSDGALGGISTGAPIRAKITFKPPSSIAKEQMTLHLPSGERKKLQIKGRHDPVIGPRAVPVVEAVCSLVIADLMQIRSDANG